MTLLHRRVGVLTLATALVLAVAADRAVSAPRLAAVPFVAVLALLILGELRVMSARVGTQQVSVSLVEIAAMVSLASLPGEWVVLTGALAAAALQTFRRKRPIKVVFAVCQTVLGLGLADLVTGTQPHLTSGLTPGLDARLAAGVLAYGLGSMLATAFVTSAAREVSIRQCLAELGWLHPAAAAANVSVGLAILLLAQYSKATLIVVPPLVAAIYLTYSLYLRADEERITWQHLERASADMIALKVDDVATQAVLHAHSLFGPDRVELTLLAGATPAGVELGWATEDGVDLKVGVGTSELAGGVTTIALADGVSASVTIDDGTGRRGLLRCDLRGPQGTLGHLSLTFADSVTLSKRERQVLASYARTVAAALERAWLYEQTRELAVQKAHEAAHDGLTGLANRSLLQERVHEAVAGVFAGGLGGQVCSLLSIDLDNFKSVNDTLGHTTGDRLLCLVADRLTEVVGDRGLVGRLGGDEFAVVLSELSDARSADQLASDILDVLRQPALLDGLRLSVGGSVGIAVCPHDAVTAEELFQRADVALYQAKESRGSSHRYRSERDSSSVSRLELVAELGLALERSEFVLHYQPQADVMLGTLTGFEALVRWQHPTRGLLAPAEFVSAVEDSGLIRAFTRRVLERAVADCAGWHRGGRSLTVAVNLSARNLVDATLPTDVEDVLLRHGLPPEALVLEITETAMLGDIEQVESVLSTLRSMGVQVSVDDFGTGYSSLAFLQRVRVNEIKVDRSFVLGMLSSDGDAALVRATIDLARSFHLRVVAEGVETAALLSALADLGCSTAQGWHIGRPAGLAATRVMLGLDPAPAELQAQIPTQSTVPQQLGVSRV